MNVVPVPKARPVTSAMAEQGLTLGVKENFGKNLRRLCRDKEIDQRTLADKMHVGESLISKWVNGKHLPRPEQWDQLVEILKCRYEDFVSDPDSPPPPKFDDLIEKLARRAGFKIVSKPNG